jgi:hypothetical protein
MIVGEVNVYPSGHDDTWAIQEGFRCLFGDTVEAGVFYSYQPASNPTGGLAAGGSRVCSTPSDLTTVRELRSKIDWLRASEQGDKLFHEQDTLSIEADLAAHS